jgi:hypothetical protein
MAEAGHLNMARQSQLTARSFDLRAIYVFGRDHDIDVNIVQPQKLESTNDGECMAARIGASEGNEDTTHWTRTNPNVLPESSKFVPKQSVTRTEQQFTIARHSSSVALSAIGKVILI